SIVSIAASTSSARSVFLLSVLGQLHHADEDPKQAIRFLVALLKEVPEHMPSLQRLARLMARSGKTKELLKITEQEIRLTFSPVRRAKLLHRAGELALELGDRDKARDCFDERYQGFEEATNEWTHADAQLVTRAPASTYDYSPLDGCTDFTVLERRLALERAEGVSAADRERLREGWQATRSRNHEGDAEGARAQAHALAEEAVSLGALSLASALSLTECDALMRLHRIDEAQVTCERAFTQAVVGSDHEGAFHSAAALSSLASLHRRDRATAKLWLDLAEAHHTFVRAPEGQADGGLARLHSARAYFAQDFDEFDTAIAEFRQAIAAYVLVQGEYSDMASYLWLSIAHIAMGQGDYRTAQEAVEEAGRIREAVFGVLHPESIEVEMYRAAILNELSPQEVDQAYARTLEHATATSGAESPLATSVTFDWGRSLKERKGCEAARERFEAVITTITRATREPGELRPVWYDEAYLLTAGCRLEAGDREGARTLAQRVLDESPPIEEGEDAEVSPQIERARELLAACDAEPDPSTDETPPSP
ncbi:MAG: tetratricopeptide repeat protein, partial [Myxococcales bacterium]|nr:tetratricopeptide repeat protein [Myxococcales bacterium]